MTGFETIVTLLRTMTERGWILKDADTVAGRSDFVILYAKKGDQWFHASLLEFEDGVLVTMSAFRNREEEWDHYLFLSTASPDEAIAAIPDVND